MDKEYGRQRFYLMYLKDSNFIYNVCVCDRDLISNVWKRYNYGQWFIYNMWQGF
jgi:hypothetical protein